MKYISRGFPTVVENKGGGGGGAVLKIFGGGGGGGLESVHGRSVEGLKAVLKNTFEKCSFSSEVASCKPADLLIMNVFTHIMHTYCHTSVLARF